MPTCKTSALHSDRWNDAEHQMAHAIGIFVIRNGVRTTSIAAALAAYRNRIVARLERARGDATGVELTRAIEDIRNGQIGGAG